MPEIGVALADRDVQHALCHPAENPDAAAYFVTNFVRTMDEERAGEIRSIPAKQVHLTVIRSLDFKDPFTVEPLPMANIHIKKSRRMLVTWIICAYNVWALSYMPNFSALLLSKDEDSVDDGGVNATVDSMFGRMAFIQSHLPDHIRRPLSISSFRATSYDHDGYVVGRAPTKRAGRSSGVMRVFSDEHAHQENADVIHVAIDPMCKHGKVYASTVNGPMNLFAEIDKKQLEGWRFLDIGWEMDPEKAEGIRATVPGPERDRFGAVVSPWLVRATQSLIDDGDVHQEYGRKYSKSKKGRILREFAREIHVRYNDDPRGPLVYNPKYPLALGGDFGHARKTVFVIAQPIGTRRLNVIGVYMGEHRNAPENARELVEKLRQLGYALPMDEVDAIPDPSAMNEEPGSGMSLWSWYRAAGFTSARPPMIVGPDSVMLGNQVVRWLLRTNRVEFAEDCGDDFFEALENYRLPVDKVTGEVTSNKPVHDMSSHPADGLRYVVTGHWTAEDVDAEWDVEDLGPSKAPKGEQELLQRGGLTMRELRGDGTPARRRDPDEAGDYDDDDDSDEGGGLSRSGIGARTVTSSLSNARF